MTLEQLCRTWLGDFTLRVVQLGYYLATGTTKAANMWVMVMVMVVTTSHGKSLGNPFTQHPHPAYHNHCR